MNLTFLVQRSRWPTVFLHAVMFLLNVYQAKVDPSFIPTLLPHILKAVNLPGAACLQWTIQTVW